MEKYLYPAIFIVAILLMLVYLFTTHRRWFLTVLVRGIAGIALILILNLILPLFHISVAVGVNPISVIGCGFLGIPGIILLYGASYFFSKY